MRRALAAGAALAVLVGAGVLGIAGPASAHNQIVSTTPAANSTLTELPKAFDIATNLPLLDVSGDGAGFAFEVRSAAGTYYGDGCISIVDTTMSIKPALGPGGDYTVIWQLVSQDGHTVSGSYPFSWRPPAGFTPAKAYDRPQNCGRQARAAATAAPGDPDAERSQTVPLADVVWIGGALLAVALAVVIAIVVLSRRGRGGQRRANRARNPE